jgi:hypothetical protein
MGAGCSTGHLPPSCVADGSPISRRAVRRPSRVGGPGAAHTRPQVDADVLGTPVATAIASHATTPSSHHPRRQLPLGPGASHDYRPPSAPRLHVPSAPRAETACAWIVARHSRPSGTSVGACTLTRALPAAVSRVRSPGPLRACGPRSRTPPTVVVVTGQRSRGVVW